MCSVILCLWMGHTFQFLCISCNFVVDKNWTFEIYNMLTLEIEFSLLQGWLFYYYRVSLCQRSAWVECLICSEAYSKSVSFLGQTWWLSRFSCIHGCFWRSNKTGATPLDILETALVGRGSRNGGQPPSPHVSIQSSNPWSEHRTPIFLGWVSYCLPWF